MLVVMYVVSLLKPINVRFQKVNDVKHKVIHTESTGCWQHSEVSYHINISYALQAPFFPLIIEIKKNEKNRDQISILFILTNMQFCHEFV